MQFRKPTRDLTFEERATWGKCPVCHAKHGERCDSNVGITLGRNVHGDPPDPGAHLARLDNAPRCVTLLYS